MEFQRGPCINDCGRETDSNHTFWPQCRKCAEKPTPSTVSVPRELVERCVSAAESAKEESMRDQCYVEAAGYRDLAASLRALLAPTPTEENREC